MIPNFVCRNSRESSEPTSAGAALVPCLPEPKQVGLYLIECIAIGFEKNVRRWLCDGGAAAQTVRTLDLSAKLRD